MTVPGLVVVFIIILVVLYMAGYPIPPILIRAIYTIIIVLLIVIVLQAFSSAPYLRYASHAAMNGNILHMRT
ncbi:MAG: hypothetical protein ACRERE_16960 [Candidatus Entotheonellia bacterium]